MHKLMIKYVPVISYLHEQSFQIFASKNQAGRYIGYYVNHT